MLNKNVKIGNWIKDEFRNDRSLGLVVGIDKESGMMLIRFPKIGKDSWIVCENRGHYKIII